ncbi:MAG: family 10 glycosylhydrolase [Lentisphaeria bacterium]|nr:family 10 glycosylhydrolase [Lentisphaeria bacterium]
MVFLPKKESGKGMTSAGLAVLMVFLLACPLCGQGRKVLVDHKTGRPVKYSSEKGDKRVVTIPHSLVRKRGEMRGVWVATAWNQDFPVCRSAAEFQNAFRRLLASLKRAGINTVIFQIRPQCDAFYISRINPWSAFLSAVEGSGIAGFDPLLFMVKESHSQGFRFHAWLNPYRVRGYAPEGKEAALKKLSPLSFARRFPDAVLAVRNGKLTGLMLDPGHPRTTWHLLETIKEILHKYDVDAIHFDDYFYPYTSIRDADVRTYEKYCRNRKISLEAWRRNNVDSLIYNVGVLVRKHNKLNRKRVEFGVSPFGVWRNRKDDPAGSPTKGLDSYGILFADSRRWVKENYVDYIAPQVYWSFSEPSAPFGCVMDWWASQVKGTHVKLYAGLTLHKYGQKKPFWEAPDELRNQILYSAALPQVDGFVLFSAGRILHASESPLLRKNLLSSLPLWGGKIP